MTEAQQPPMFPSLDSIESVLWPGLALLVFVATGVLADIMILLATRWRILDIPNRRSAHALPTARAGGIPLALVSSLAALAVCMRWPSLTGRVVGGVVLPSMVIAVVGLIDDIRPLRAVLRLVIHVACGVAVGMALGPIRVLGIPGVFSFATGAAAWPLTVLWVVGMINAFNFMDGSDAMAGLGAVVVGVFFVLVGFLVGSPPLVLLAAFYGAAAGGFLVFNWPPARIFMGDVGSAFLGTCFAALPLIPGRGASADIFLPMVMVLWPYVVDPFLSVCRRAASGHDPLVPHREFLFHRLVRSGWSHRSVAVLYALLAAIGGAAGASLLLPGLPSALRPWLVAVVPVLAAALIALSDTRYRRMMRESAASAAGPA